MSEIILSRIQRCHQCGREVQRRPLDYEENPFCTVCLAERIDQASPSDGVQWHVKGHYVIAQASRKHHSSAREHH
jgi:hypothetical protein